MNLVCKAGAPNISRTLIAVCGAGFLLVHNQALREAESFAKAPVPSYALFVLTWSRNTPFKSLTNTAGGCLSTVMTESDGSQWQQPLSSRFSLLPWSHFVQDLWQSCSHSLSTNSTKSEQCRYVKSRMASEDIYILLLARIEQLDNSLGLWRLPEQSWRKSIPLPRLNQAKGQCTLIGWKVSAGDFYL